jgi:hypothetical protein
MYAYYNANYNLSNFANDPAVATLNSIYSTVNSGPWKDKLDASPNDGDIDVTYSFMADGTRMDKKNSTLFSAFNQKFSTVDWQNTFIAQLNRWASVSKLDFHPFNGTNDDETNTSLSFNTSGASQNDPRFGDIRIGAHIFDGGSNVLAHTYYPPPNGATAAGDAHFDEAENWTLGGSSSISSTPSGHGNGNNGKLIDIPDSPSKGNSFSNVLIPQSVSKASSSKNDLLTSNADILA